MSLRKTQEGLFNKPEPTGPATPSVQTEMGAKKKPFGLKAIGIALAIIFSVYASVGELFLGDWAWSKVTGRRAGNTESEAVKTAADAKAKAAGKEEAARVVEQVKGEAQKAEIQTHAAGERVYAELPGRVATDEKLKKMELISSCRDKRRQLADEGSAKCMAQPNMSEQACSFARDDSLRSLDQDCGRVEDVRAQLDRERTDANAP